jgi:hypothetical protein
MVTVTPAQSELIEFIPIYGMLCLR